MKQHQNVWLPDHERHMVDWMTKNGQLVDGRGTYQYKKWLACAPYIKSYRNAVDVGAHVGFWSMHMIKVFGFVHAFEPIEEHQECFKRNLGGWDSYALHCFALGDEQGHVSLTIPDGSSGGTHVIGKGDIPMVTLDYYELDCVDFMKIDCEGFELQVLKGSRDTITRCRPCIIVEQKTHIMAANYGIRGTPALEYLRLLGAQQRRAVSGDYIFTF